MTLLRLLLAAFAIGVGPAQAQDAADYPSRTVRLIVPSSTGGPVDAVARILADAFKTVWKEPVVVESKPGAGNSTGALFVANAPPDGYTLLVISDSITVNPSLYPALNKDPLKQFEAISVLVTAPQILVARNDLPANDLRGFIDAAKASPGKLNVASAGIGTISHLTEVMLDQRMGLKTAHIPFRGAAPAVTAVLGKHVDAAWVMPAPALPYVAIGSAQGAGGDERGARRAVPAGCHSGGGGDRQFPDRQLAGTIRTHWDPQACGRQDRGSSRGADEEPRGPQAPRRGRLRCAR